MLFTYFESLKFSLGDVKILPRRHREHEVKISNLKSQIYHGGTENTEFKS
jgi:hypothetical protein